MEEITRKMLYSDNSSNSSQEDLDGGVLRLGSWSSHKKSRLCFRAPTTMRGMLRWMFMAFTAGVLLWLIRGVFTEHQREVSVMVEPPKLAWEAFTRVNSYYNGIKTLVPYTKWEPEYPVANGSEHFEREPAQPIYSLPKLREFNPYPDYLSQEYLSNHYPVEACYLSPINHAAAPPIYSYPGLPQNQPNPLFGSYELLGVHEDLCFDRYGRFGPYGLGYDTNQGGLGIGVDVEKAGSQDVWEQLGGQIDWSGMDWRAAQDQCYEANKIRFEGPSQKEEEEKLNSPDFAARSSTGRKTLARTAVVIRTWMGFTFTAQVILNFRAMINELALRSGGEYAVHFLVHCKDTNIPIWSDPLVYEEALNLSLPEEFRGLGTLWSEKQMELVYPPPFAEPVENDSGTSVWGVYRSAHLPLQWFAHSHPQYEFFWNWEMDMRYTGHYYELFDRMGAWARAQPRKGLWERSAKYYIPALHGSWANFSQRVDFEMAQIGHTAVSGPARFPGGDHAIPDISGCTSPQDATCGIGEDADLITLNPIFDPNNTFWVFEKDVTGYDTNLPIPPRRNAIVTAGRLSKRLLLRMHEETWKNKHTMFTEMWPPTAALHHGLKAVYAPHPVYFDRAWPPHFAEQTFNGGVGGSTSGPGSVFGLFEHNFQGTSWYYNSGFAGALWRRWLGFAENGEGGFSRETQGTQRMCLRSQLLHPIKFDQGPNDL